MYYVSSFYEYNVVLNYSKIQTDVGQTDEWITDRAINWRKDEGTNQQTSSHNIIILSEMAELLPQAFPKKITYRWCLACILL